MHEHFFEHSYRRLLRLFSTNEKYPQVVPIDRMPRYQGFELKLCNKKLTKIKLIVLMPKNL